MEKDLDDLAATVVGATAAHRRLEAAIAPISDELVGRPSLLPDWTVGHVLAHLARNAESHVRLLDAALAGEAAEQYAGGNEQRSRDIEAGADRPAAELRADIAATNAALEAAWARMTPAAWGGHGLAQGREWPCRLLPFHRWREVEIHHVDLGLGYSPVDWPAGYVRRDLPLALATLPDRLGPGPQAALLAWLVGRSPQPAGIEPAPWQSKASYYDASGPQPAGTGAGPAGPGEPGGPTGYRFYGELAAWWPLLSPPEEYAEEAAFAATVLASASIPVRDVLELGSGGGHNAAHLKAGFTLTLVDLSEEMLDVSRRLNPECEHHRGDMRTVRLGREFDAVFVHDAIDYMTTEADLQLAVGTAFVHCRPGGVAVFVPDDTSESFRESSDHGGTDAADGRGARYLEWAWDPDPGDTWTRAEYGFLLRDADGSVRAAHETHRLGLFGRADWIRLLTQAGFDATSVTEATSQDRPPRQLFVGRRPAS